MPKRNEKRNEAVKEMQDSGVADILSEGVLLKKRQVVRPGAPKGNRNAACPHRAKGYRHNRNAVKTGEHETIWKDTMSKEDQIMLDCIDTNPMIQLDEDIRLLSYREQRMLGYLKMLQAQKDDTEQKNVYKMQNVPMIVEVYDEKTGFTHKQKIMRLQKVLVEQVSQTKDLMNRILRVEEALTRVQGKKIKAVEAKNKIADQSGGSR